MIDLGGKYGQHLLHQTLSLNTEWHCNAFWNMEEPYVFVRVCEIEVVDISSTCSEENLSRFQEYVPLYIVIHILVH